MRSPNRLRAPLRILVKGSAPAAGGLDYPALIEQELLAGGRHAVVRDHTAPGERVATGIRNWENQVFPWSPDVVVLHYGSVEARRPRWAARFADDLETLVRRCIYISNPLVLLPALPGDDAEHQVINAALAEVVERIEKDNVRVFDTPGSPELVARQLAELIGPWCDKHVPV